MSILSLPHRNIHTGNLILVNAAYGFHTPELRNLVHVPAAVAAQVQLLDRRAAALLEELMKKIDGWHSIVPVSGWRSHEEQQRIWDDTLSESGEEYTRTFVAVPGHSEHETGLAIDLGIRSESIDFICPDFPYDGICGSFRRLAAGYGFVERYPAGKEPVTGIGHEPWHFRYVGVPHACIMTEHGFTLEEYIDFLRDYPHGQNPYFYSRDGLEFSISYRRAAPKGSTILTLPEHKPYSVSGNNADGYIITEWRNTHADTQELRWN